MKPPIVGAVLPREITRSCFNRRYEDQAEFLPKYFQDVIKT
jgi:hypothetical protein